MVPPRRLCQELHVHKDDNFVGFDVHESAVDFDNFFRALDRSNDKLTRYEHAKEITMAWQDIKRASVVHGADRVGIALKVDLKRRVHLDCHGWFALLVSH